MTEATKSQVQNSREPDLSPSRHAVWSTTLLHTSFVLSDQHPREWAPLYMAHLTGLGELLLARGDQSGFLSSSLTVWCVLCWKSPVVKRLSLFSPFSFLSPLHLTLLVCFSCITIILLSSWMIVLFLQSHLIAGGPTLFMVNMVVTEGEGVDYTTRLEKGSVFSETGWSLTFTFKSFWWDSLAFRG